MSRQSPVKVPTSNVAMARTLLIAHSRALKSRIIDHLTSGDRDYTALHAMVNEFVDIQTGADALGYPTVIEDNR